MSEDPPQEEPGVVMVPLIVDSAAFDRRTAELREAGFTHEADARDRFAQRHRGNWGA